MSFKEWLKDFVYGTEYGDAESEQKELPNKTAIPIPISEEESEEENL